jgi:hypothetical protein
MRKQDSKKAQTHYTICWQIVAVWLFTLMAIEFGHFSIVSAGDGSNIVGLSSYVARDQRECAIDEMTFNFRHRASDLRHTEINLPSEANSLFKDGAALWNAVLERECTIDRKTKERRLKKRAQVAKHLVLAAPRELSLPSKSP